MYFKEKHERKKEKKIERKKRYKPSKQSPISLRICADTLSCNEHKIKHNTTYKYKYK